MSTFTYYTEEGLKKMKEELKYLQTQGRQDIAKQIAEAREKGDLSENAEYEAAKEAQGLLELKIFQLQKQIVEGRVIDKSKLDTSKVSILSYVNLINEKTKKEICYQLVPVKEADIKNGKISIESPIAKALLGKKVGEEVLVKTPSLIIKFTVLKIHL